MIISREETLYGKAFRYHCSDQGFMIRKIGTDEIYSEAYDLPDSDYEYEETDIPIEVS